MIEMKQCTGCRNSYPATTEYFHANRNNLRARCKSCCKRDYAPGSYSHGKRITQKMIPAAMIWHCKGRTYQEIADDLGVSRDSVISLFADRNRAA